MQIQKKSMWFLLHVIVVTCAREPSSPICSRYDYEERLLERVLRNELAPETTLSEIMKTNAKVVDALNQLEDGKAEVDSLLAVMEKKKIEMESRLSDFISNASNYMNTTLAANVGSLEKKQIQMESRLNKLKVPTIYFRARITTYPTDVSSGLDVIFPKVEVNEGQGYDPSTGKFTASIPGMYLFSVQYCVYSKKYVHLEIVHQGNTLQRSSHYDHADDWPCVTMQASTPVAMGQQIWQRSQGSSTLYADLTRFTSFSGTLIHV